jgi:hypothetical protein
MNPIHAMPSFLAQGPIEQLNMIIDLLGTPKPEEMRGCCEGALKHVRLSLVSLQISIMHQDFTHFIHST